MLALTDWSARRKDKRDGGGGVPDGLLGRDRLDGAFAGLRPDQLFLNGGLGLVLRSRHC
jgi:hypothetical protein